MNDTGINRVGVIQQLLRASDFPKVESVFFAEGSGAADPEVDEEYANDNYFLGLLKAALFDYGLTNAEIHYFMANPALKNRDRSHRFHFRKRLCDKMGSTDWKQFEDQDIPNSRVINILNNDEESDYEDTNTNLGSSIRTEKKNAPKKCTSHFNFLLSVPRVYASDFVWSSVFCGISEISYHTPFLIPTDGK